MYKTAPATLGQSCNKRFEVRTNRRKPPVLTQYELLFFLFESIQLKKIIGVMNSGRVDVLIILYFNVV